MILNSVTVFILILTVNSITTDSTLDERDAAFWYRENRMTLESKLKHANEWLSSTAVKRKAKNVIFFVGDGMGMTTITASRIYMNSREKTDPIFETLSFEKFPFTGLVKVNNLDKMVSDSGAASTSYLRGVKTNYGVIGCSGRVKQDDCLSSNNKQNRVQSLFDWANSEGKSTGLVTTTDITHATPAGAYSHTAQRDWRSSAPNGCIDVADQLVNGRTGRNISVIFGGGREQFLPTKCRDCEPGIRKDGRNLINEWLDIKKDEKKVAKFITNYTQLRKLNAKSVDSVLGLFTKGHFDYNLEQTSSSPEPTISEMTVKALKILQKNSEGFLLFVEGGRIDLAHHKNRPRLAIDETYEFHKAIEAVLSRVNINETLIVVTADHSQTLTINGQFNRGDDIFDFSKYGFSILMYGNGPGFQTGATSPKGTLLSDDIVLNILTLDFRKVKVAVKSAAFTSNAKHGGEDVPIYAIGPGAHLFTGVFDQTFIPHAISFASCIGPQKDMCTL